MEPIRLFVLEQNGRTRAYDAATLAGVTVPLETDDGPQRIALDTPERVTAFFGAGQWHTVARHAGEPTGLHNLTAKQWQRDLPGLTEGLAWTLATVTEWTFRLKDGRLDPEGKPVPVTPQGLFSLPDGVTNTLDTIIWHDCCYRESIAEQIAQMGRLEQADSLRNWLRQETEAIHAPHEGATP